MLDRNEREQARFALADLPKHVERFGFIVGVRRRAFRDQDPVNLEASELVARLHDALRASSYGGHDLELFLVQTVFCVLADDTGIFEPRDIFLHFLKERTAADGSDVGLWLTRLFQVLNTPPGSAPAGPRRGPDPFPARERRTIRRNGSAFFGRTPAGTGSSAFPLNK